MIEKGKTAESYEDSIDLSISFAELLRSSRGHRDEDAIIGMNRYFNHRSSSYCTERHCNILWRTNLIQYLIWTWVHDVHLHEEVP